MLCISICTKNVQVQPPTRSKQNLLHFLTTHLFAHFIVIISNIFSHFKTSNAFVPGFLLHPTFSEQPPTNGAKTRLVKMCWGQHAVAYLLRCVKTTVFTKKRTWKHLGFWEISKHFKFKRYVQVVRAEGFLSVYPYFRSWMVACATKSRIITF